MNFKALLATLATVATVIAPTAAVAGTGTPGKAALRDALTNVGVPINGGHCESNTMGYFSYKTNTWADAEIFICTNHAKSDADQWETLRHEAIHVAQKCENRDHGHTFESLTTWSFLKGQATDSDANFVMNNYPEAKWLIEIEAFTFMKKSNQTVANLVNKACN
jgi:hypothetical protein